jgi:hypothetical protein
MSIAPLEMAVLQKLLGGDHPVLTVLRAQLFGLSVVLREETGTGFFTEFAVGDTACPAVLPLPRVQFGDVEATIPGLKHGAGFLLYVEEGLLHMLEGYSYEEPWPDHIDQFSLKYSDPNRRAVLAKLG